MGSKDLRTRSVWQDYSGEQAGQAEKSFEKSFEDYFKGSELEVRPKPSEFTEIYVDFPLDPEVHKEIYNPDVKITRHGIKPDYAIDNVRSGKTLYVEVKRQDGWVEGKPRKAGRGNAHERSCKYFTPGLTQLLRKRGGITSEESLPFWVVYIGDITRDPCRVREISFWYQGYESHFFMWRDQTDATPLLRHFDSFLRHLLD